MLVSLMPRLIASVDTASKVNLGISIFWALETTWAARHAGVSVTRLEDVIRCTFFDWDAVAYDLRARRLICSRDYLGRIRQGTLDINLRPTPSPEGNLLRWIRRLVVWRLRLPSRPSSKKVWMRQLSARSKRASVGYTINRSHPLGKTHVLHVKYCSTTIDFRIHLSSLN